ncbi:MAG TPA: hypothetical protein VM528_05435 [Burkholderiaceae bacterium]|nr:hypothetical protein [Burkholderiaceae bacterium]
MTTGGRTWTPEFGSKFEKDPFAAGRDYGVVIADTQQLPGGRARVRLDAAASAQRRQSLGAPKTI